MFQLHSRVSIGIRHVLSFTAEVIILMSVGTGIEQQWHPSPVKTQRLGLGLLPMGQILSVGQCVGGASSNQNTTYRLRHVLPHPLTLCPSTQGIL